MPPSTSITLNWGSWYVSISLNNFFFKYYLVFALSGLGGDHDVSRVTRERKNKKVWETLRSTFLFFWAYRGC